MNQFLFCFCVYIYLYIPVWWFLRSIIYGFCKFLVITDTSILYLLCTSAIPSQVLPFLNLYLLYALEISEWIEGQFLYIYMYIKKSWMLMDNPQLNSSINNITLNYHGIKVIL